MTKIIIHQWFFILLFLINVYEDSKMAAPMNRIFHTCRCVFTKRLPQLSRTRICISRSVTIGTVKRQEQHEKSNERETHFGFERVSEEEKTGKGKL